MNWPRMRFILVPVALAVSLPIAAPMAPAAQAAEKPKVGYLGADSPTLSPEALTALDAGAVAGIEATTPVRAVPISSAEVSRMKSGRLCASHDCAKAIAARTGVEYLVRAAARQTGQADYAITLDLIRVEPFGVLFTGEDQCPGCVPAKLGRRVELAVSALVAKLVESLENKPLITEGSGKSPAPAADGRSLPSALPPSPGEASVRSWRWVPWTAGALAIVSLAGGALAWRADGNGACSLESMERQCPRVYATKPTAIALGTVGIISAAGAVWSFYKLRDRAGHEVAVGMAGTNLIVTGRF